jgi:RNA polymerase sigma-70 factor, ECF subfamily
MNLLDKKENGMVDKKIIGQAQRGDSFFCLELIRKIEGFVYQIAYYILKNQSDALSISQQILVEIYKDVSLYDEKETFRIWVQKKVIVACIQHLREKPKNKTTL